MYNSTACINVCTIIKYRLHGAPTYARAEGMRGGRDGIQRSGCCMYAHGFRHRGASFSFVCERYYCSHAMPLCQRMTRPFVCERYHIQPCHTQMTCSFAKYTTIPMPLCTSKIAMPCPFVKGERFVYTALPCHAIPILNRKSCKNRSVGAYTRKQLFARPSAGTYII